MHWIKGCVTDRVERNRAVWVIVLVLICMGIPSEAQDQTLRTAIDLISRGQYLDAEETLIAHLDTHPEQAEAWYLLGRCRNRLELHEEAYNALTNAMSYGAQTPDLNREIGFSLQGMGRGTAALQYLRKADSQDSDAWMARAQIQLTKKGYGKAKQALDQVFELGGRLEAAAYLLRARIRALEGKPQLAKNDLRNGLDHVRQASVRSSYTELGKLLNVLDDRVFRLYSGIFYREHVNEKQGTLTRTRRDEALRGIIGSALSGFREQVDEPDRSPDRFRQFVREREPLAQTEKLFNNINQLFGQLHRFKLSEKQEENLRFIMVRPITPEETTTDFLVRTIEAGGDS